MHKLKYVKVQQTKHRQTDGDVEKRKSETML